MCLITLQPKPKIAEEDIPIFKLICHGNNDTLRSIYYDFEWEFGKVVETEMKRTNDYSFFDSRDADYIKQNIDPNFTVDYPLKRPPANVTVIAEGFHSVTAQDRVRNFGYPIAKGIIPKGSEYYENGDFLLVSNKIMLVEIID